MDEPKVRKLNVLRLSRDLVFFEFKHEGKYVRRQCRMDALVAFLLEEVQESNLAADARPVSLSEFVEQKYLPFAAKPRLSNPRSYKSEAALAKAVCLDLGGRKLHDLKSRDSEKCKMEWLRKKCVNNTIKKRLNCLRRVMAYAVAVGLVKTNPIPAATGLHVGNRSEIWLRRSQIDHLLSKCPPLIAPLVEYMVLTGARLGEALDFRVGDLRGGRLFVPTLKRKKPMRSAMREFEVAGLGPRFTALLARLQPHPVTGYYFYANKFSKTSLSVAYANRRFIEAREAAELPEIHMHDLRGTFAMHRAMVVATFHQLQQELGHRDARSVQSYLDSASQFRSDPKESIFYVALEGKESADGKGYGGH